MTFPCHSRFGAVLLCVETMLLINGLSQMARDIGAKQSTELKAEMMRALEGLEELVKEGRAAMDEQRSRQEEVRNSKPNPLCP